MKLFKEKIDEMGIRIKSSSKYLCEKNNKKNFQGNEIITL
jgi:hypothetical protein